MKKQIMISTSSSGRLVALVMGRNVLLLSVMLVSSMLAFGLWGIYTSTQQARLVLAIQQNVAQLKQLKQQHRETVTGVQQQLQSEKNKALVYTRTLGQLQARMTRLDALGSRLVDVASLDKKEFNFDIPPARGGLKQPPLLTDDPQVVQGMADVAGRLTQMDAQLSAVNYVFESKRSRSDAKPHSWPTIGGWISSRFGPRIDPFTGGQAMHYGVDIANRAGAPVLASSAGVISFAGKMKDFGFVVDVEHAYGYKTRYAHLSAIGVKIGDVVSDRQRLGTVGSTGHSTGPHIHFELRQNGQLIDPKAYLHRS